MKYIVNALKVGPTKSEIVATDYFQNIEDAKTFL
jgi:hypothetical protein